MPLLDSGATVVGNITQLGWPVFHVIGPILISLSGLQAKQHGPIARS